MEESSDSERSEVESSITSSASLSPSEEQQMEGQEIIIVVAGRSGAGKSTLIANMFGIEDAVTKKISAKSITTKEQSWITKKNGITIKIVDTVGGSQIKEKRFHLLIYCMSVAPNSKFCENIDVMNDLYGRYGENIFKHCVVACTFSNYAWDHVENNIDAYKAHIREFSKEFQGFARKLGAPTITVKAIFDEDFNTLSDENIVPAIPAGKQINDNKILPTVQQSWSEIIFEQMKNKCVKERQSQLLQYHFGRQLIKRFLKSQKGKVGVGGAGGGAAVIAGAVIGAAAGTPLGPPGMAMGGIVGAGVGVVGAFAATGTITGAMAIKDKLEERKVKKEVEKKS